MTEALPIAGTYQVRPQPADPPQPIPLPPGEWPPEPSREQVCGVTCRSMCSCPPVYTKQWGEFRLWDLIIPTLHEASDRQACYAAKRALGDTHCMIPYARGGGQIYYGAYPYSVQNDPQFELNPEAFIVALREYIMQGFIPIICLQSDGEQNREVAFSQLDSLIPLLRANGLTRRVLVFLCWDSIFYGWANADHVGDFGRKFRELCPEGHLSMEHNSGHIPLGEGGQDFQRGGRMSWFDVIKSEYDLHSNQPADQPIKGNPTVWQINRRLEEHYVAAPDQDGDFEPRYYLGAGTDRGPFFHCAFEWWDPFDAIRNQTTVEQVDRVRQYMRDQGCRWTG